VTAAPEIFIEGALVVPRVEAPIEGMGDEVPPKLKRFADIVYRV